MKLAEILAISGQPGLYKYIAQSRNGIIVESLADGKRIPVQGTSKVSSLGDIAIFTETADVPLAEVFQNIYDINKGAEAISPKSPNEALKKEMKRFLPEYDEDRVHVSDMKKLFSWYNILLKAGITTFVEEETEKTDAVEEPEADKKSIKKVRDANSLKDDVKEPKSAKVAAKPVNTKPAGAKVAKQKTAPKAK